MPFDTPRYCRFGATNVWPRHHRCRPRNACPPPPSRTCSRSTIRAMGRVFFPFYLSSSLAAVCPRPRPVSEQFIRDGKRLQSRYPANWVPNPAVNQTPIGDAPSADVSPAPVTSSPVGSSGLRRCEKLALIDTAEVTIETLYQHRRHRFLARRVAPTAPSRFGVGYHREWHRSFLFGRASLPA